MSKSIAAAWRRLFRSVGMAACCLAIASGASAQDTLVLAKNAYSAAAYEEALRLLSPLDTPEAGQYKALCYLALGRPQEAARVVDSLVTNAPLFLPSEEEVPPRFVALVTDARRRLIPGLAKRAFTDGRERYTAKAHKDAIGHFEMVMTLTADPLFKDSPDAQDLRTLASGFMDLAKAALPAAASAPSAAAPVAAAPTEAQVPAQTQAQPQVPTPTPVTATARQDTAPPRAPVAPPPTPEVTQPIAVRQEIPLVPANVVSVASPVAMVRVLIGPDGRVTSASIERSAHPMYDRMLLQAANSWIYKPGTLDGRPVPTEKVVTVRLR